MSLKPGDERWLVVEYFDGEGNVYPVKITSDAYDVDGTEYGIQSLRSDVSLRDTAAESDLYVSELEAYQALVARMENNAENFKKWRKELLRKHIPEKRRKLEQLKAHKMQPMPKFPRVGDTVYFIRWNICKQAEVIDLYYQNDVLRVRLRVGDPYHNTEHEDATDVYPTKRQCITTLIKKLTKSHKDYINNLKKQLEEDKNGK